MRKILCSKSFVSLIAILIVSGVSFAQTGTSAVRGTVKDQQGNLVAGATVTLTNPEKNFSRTQTTSQDGTYVFSAVLPGTYKLDVESPGFKKTAVSEVKAMVDSSVDADVTLEIGAVSETVGIAARAAASEW